MRLFLFFTFHFSLFTFHSSHAQSLSNVLSEIEKHNTTLAALRQQADADKLANRTDIFLADPEIGFNYLWGSPTEIGRRKDFSISQSLDVATLSGSKRRLADDQDKLVEWQYRADRMKIMLEARQLIADVVYYNNLLAVQTVRRQTAESLLTAQKKRLDAGDANVLEYNDARLSLTQLDAEILQTNNERDVALAELSRLNDGHAVTLTTCEYGDGTLPSDFDEWYALAEQTNPVLGYVRHDVEVNKRQLTVTTQQSLPSLSVGYMGEKTMGELYHGISLGISVPLWSNKNKVRQARAAISAAEARRTDATRQVYLQLQSLYQRAIGLQRTSSTYRRALSEGNNTDRLRRALNAGEISMVDYLTQLSLYYDAEDRALSAEHDYHRTLAELAVMHDL